MSVVSTRKPRTQYSKQVKEIVIYQYDILGSKCTQIAISLDMAVRSVQRIVQNWKEFGLSVDNPSRAGRPKIMNHSHVQVIDSFNFFLLMLY